MLRKDYAKRLQTLADKKRTDTNEVLRLRDLNPSEDYPYYFILSDIEILTNGIYHLENEIKKVKLEINYLRCVDNKELYSKKRTLAYNARLASYEDYDNIDF